MVKDGGQEKRNWLQIVLTVATGVMIPIGGSIYSTVLDIQTSQIRMEATINKGAKALEVHEAAQQERSKMLRKVHESVDNPCMKCKGMSE